MRMILSVRKISSTSHTGDVVKETTNEVIAVEQYQKLQLRNRTRTEQQLKLMKGTKQEQNNNKK